MKRLFILPGLPANLTANALNVALVSHSLLSVLRIAERAHLVIHESLINRMFLILSRLGISYRKSTLLFIYLIVSHSLLLVSPQSNASSPELKEKFITCLDGQAIRVPPKYPFGGAYVRCEDLDSFAESLERGDRTSARRLLLTKPKSESGGEIKKKIRRENFFQCTEEVQVDSA